MKEARDGVCTFLYDDPQVFKTMIYHLYSKPMDDVLEPKHLVMCLTMAEKYGIGMQASYHLILIHTYNSYRFICCLLFEIVTRSHLSKNCV